MSMKHRKQISVAAGCLLAGAVCGNARAQQAVKLQEVSIALEGFCPVSYQTSAAPVKGQPRFASEYQGYTYFLSSKDAKKQFDANPGKYAPQIGGLGALALGGPYGNSFWGDPFVYSVVDGKLYLLSCERAKKSFVLKPNYYARRAQALFDEPKLNGYCPVSYLMGGKPVKGKPEFKQVFRDQTYYLSSAKAVEFFKKQGADAIPQYKGFCAEGISQGRRFPGDPTVFAILAGKTYLFFDESAKVRFMSKATSLVDQADEKWSGLRVVKGPLSRE